MSAPQITTWWDPLLSSVLCFIRERCPDSTDGESKPYWMWRMELTAHDGWIVWEGRVVVPPPGRESLLIELHGGHPGISQMKSLHKVWCGGQERIRRLRTWSNSVQTYAMSTKSSHSSAKSIVLANLTLDTVACGLCRKDVPNSGWYLFQSA